jgi:hypothetical protein
MRPKANASLYSWADHYLSLGLSVIPLRDTKLPGIRWKEYQARVSTRRELAQWFVGKKGGKSPFWGLALVCGAVSGRLARIDFDNQTDFDTILKDHPGLTQDFPVFQSQRKDGGFGLLFRSLEPVPTLPQKSFDNCPDTEVRGEGSITVAPPTTGYRWLSEPPDDIPVVSGVALLKGLFAFNLMNRERLVSSVGRSATGELSRLLTETEPGERNAAIVRIASMLRARDIDQDTARMVVLNAYETHWSQDDMDEDEVTETFDRAWKRYEHEGVRVTGIGSGAAAPLSTGKFGDGDEDKPASLTMRSFSEIDPHDEVTDDLIQNLVIRGSEGNTVIGADTKMGKTSLMVDALTTASRGDPVWWAYPVPKPIRAVIIDQEAKFRTMRDGQLKMSTVIGAPNDDNLKVITADDGHFDVEHPDALDLLYRTLYEFEPDVVVIDGWGWFVAHQEVDPKYVKPALAWVKKLRLSLNCATVIVHHFKKGQQQNFTGKITDHQQFVDQLDKIAGLKRLSDQAHTVLGYAPIPGYGAFGILDGRSNHTGWAPPKTVIDYDEVTVTHRVVPESDGYDLFDAETFKNLWPRRMESRAVKNKISYLMNRNGWDRQHIADLMGVNRSQVSRWYSGDRQPSKDMEEKLEALYQEARLPRKAGDMPKKRRLVDA